MSKVMRFNLNSQDIKIKEILNNKDFIKIEIWAISDAYPNNNNSHFPLDTMETNVNEGNFYNKPILGRWNSTYGDYEVHNSTVKYDPEYNNTYFDYENGEVPIGVIRGTDDIKIVRKDGLNWIVFTAVLWVKYGYEGIKKILKSRRKKVSVEVSVLDSYFDENDIEIFKKWSFDGVTILGNLPNSNIPAHEGIENAHLTILEKLQEDNFSNQVRALQFAYQELDDENNVIKEDNSSFNIKNQEKEDKTLALTYEQKRNLLESFLRDNITMDECDYIWVADLDETFCFYCVSGEYYKTQYSIVDAENDEPIVTIDISEAERVIRDWKTFIEDTEGTNPENESSKTFEDESNDDETDSKDTEDCKTCNEDKSDDKNDDVDESNENSEEVKMDDDETFDEDENNSDEQKEDTETECKMNENDEDESQDEQCRMNEDDSDKDDDSEGSDNVQKDESTCVLHFNDEDHVVSLEVFNYFTTIISERDNAVQSLQNTILERDTFSKELENIKEKITVSKNKELGEKAYSLAMKKGFTEDESNVFKEDCLNGKYTDLEALTKEIAYQSFLRDEEAEKSSLSQKEFSAKISNSNNIEKSQMDNDNPFAGIKKYVNEK